MMRLLKIARSGPKNQAAEDAAEMPETQDDALARAVGEALAQVDTNEASDEAQKADTKARKAGGRGKQRRREPVELESEIGSILAMIRSRKDDDVLPEIDLPEETGATYQLLTELDRIWRSA